MSPCRFRPASGLQTHAEPLPETITISRLPWAAQNSEEVFICLHFPYSNLTQTLPSLFLIHERVLFSCVCFSCGWEKTLSLAGHEKFKFCSESLASAVSGSPDLFVYPVWPFFLFQQTPYNLPHLHFLCCQNVHYWCICGEEIVFLI